MSADKSSSGGGSDGANQGGKTTDTLVKVVLVFFISLLSFSVGTFVGKQVSDSDHRRLALEGEGKAGRNVASAETHGHNESAESEGGEKISEKELASLTEEFVNEEAGTTVADAELKADLPGDSASDGLTKVAPTSSPEQERGIASAADSQESTSAGGYKTFNRGKAAPHPAKVANKAAVEVAEKLASGQAPTDGAREPRKPASVLPSVAASAVGKYTLQVGSYLKEAEAKDRASELQSKGWNAFYVSASVKGSTYYRVSVGLFEDVKKADEFRNQYMRESKSKDVLVQKVVQSL